MQIGMPMNLTAKIATLLLWATAAQAESVDVKYRGPVDLKPFACTDTPRSSFIQRVCYDEGQSYMLISLRGTYYHYCELPAATFDAFVTAAIDGTVLQPEDQGLGLRWAV
jgi:KTSC domain